MRRADARVQSRRAERLTALERANPAWARWFALWRAAARALPRTPACEIVVGRDRPPEAPVLHGATLRLNRRQVDRLLRDLARAANAAWPRDRDSLSLLESAFRNGAVDGAAAQEDGAGGGALPAVLQFVVPVLLTGSAHLAEQAPGRWPHGYCPLCGAWPLRAELRGVERERRLRCGRCGADWLAPWLRCTYCGEQDHERLGLLSAEGQLESRRVETCATCRRYLKAFAALVPAGPLDLLLDDLETIELDLAARERGFTRPDGLGHAIAVRVVPA